MLIRKYREGWIDNASLVGFINIVGKDNIDIYENYIEFNHDLLRDFKDKYFNYFLTKYDVAERITNRIDFSLSILKKACEKDPSKKKLDTTILRNIISTESKKIEKSHREQYGKIKEIVSNIAKAPTYDDVETYAKEFLEIIQIKDINEKITLNKVKNELQKNFFGQVSFLNVNKAGKPLEEIKDIFHKDYIYPIVIYGDFEDAINDFKVNKDANVLKSFIKRCLIIESNDIQKEFFKDFKKIIKTIDIFLSKNCDVDQILQYLDTLEICELCLGYKSIGTQLSESTFALLGVSNKNAENFFWDFCDKKEICSICKLMMFCLPAGVSSAKSESYGEQVFTFINAEGTINDLLSNNANDDILSSGETRLSKYLTSDIYVNKSIAEYKLMNTLFVKFSVTLDGGYKETKLSYDSVSLRVARILVNHSKDILSITDVKLRNKVIECIVENKNLDRLLMIELRGVILEKNIFETIRSKDFMQLLKIKKIISEGSDFIGMELENTMLEAGRKVRAYYIAIGNIKKCNTVGYKLLNLIKSGNSNDVADALLRIIMSSKVSLPIGLAKVLDEGIINQKDKEYVKSLTYSFVNGLVNSLGKKVDEENDLESSVGGGENV